MTQTKAQLLDFTIEAPDKISEGNSKVEVVDSGTGYVVAEADGSEKLTAMIEDDNLLACILGDYTNQVLYSYLFF